MKKTAISIITLFLLTGIATAADKLDLADETSQISYSLGYQIGGDFRRQHVGLDAKAVVQGIEDAIADVEPLLSAEQMMSLLVSLKQKVVAVQQRELVRDSKQFMQANLTKPGIKELPGGSQYRVLVQGSGSSPSATDTVEVHFDTKRTDGTSIATTRSEPTPRSYQVGKMLPGLKEALLMMQPGAKWEVFVPPGSGGRNEALGNSGVLIYELELIAVHPAAG